jgi:hypothetical protein
VTACREGCAACAQETVERLSTLVDIAIADAEKDRAARVLLPGEFRYESLDIRLNLLRLAREIVELSERVQGFDKKRTVFYLVGLSPLRSHDVEPGQPPKVAPLTRLRVTVEEV